MLPNVSKKNKTAIIEEHGINFSSHNQEASILGGFFHSLKQGFFHNLILKIVFWGPLPWFYPVASASRRSILWEGIYNAFF